MDTAGSRDWVWAKFSKLSRNQSLSVVLVRMEAVVFEPMQQDVEGHHPPEAEAMFVAATQPPQPMLLSHRSKDTQNCGSIPTAMACREHPKENRVSQMDFAFNDVKHGAPVNRRAARHVTCAILSVSKGKHMELLTTSMDHHAASYFQGEQRQTTWGSLLGV